MEFEAILEKVGNYGPFQRNLLFFFTVPHFFLAPSLVMALIFIVTAPDHWCNVPELVTSNMSVAQRRALSEAPQNAECIMRDMNYTAVVSFPELSFSNYKDTVKCKNGWEYDKSNFEATAATRFNMVCENSHYPSLVLTLQNLGSLVGTPISGALGDRYGRKKVLFMAVFLISITEMLAVLSPSFPFFAVLKTINGTVIYSVFVLPFILVSELVAPEKRVLVGGVTNCAWMAGMCILPLIVYLTRSWIILGIFNTIASACILLFWWFVPESPIWLVTRERYDEALKIMKRIGQTNGMVENEVELLKKLKSLGKEIKEKRNEEKTNFCSSPVLRKIFLIITFCWIANTTAYMGLQYNVISLEGNIFLNFFLLSVVEAPGNFLFWTMMQRMGRRWSASVGFFVAGIVILASLTGLPYSEITCSVVGKLIISGVFMVTDQQACELFPTVSRSSAMAAGKSFCKVFTITVPYLIYAGKYGRSIPFVIMSLLCIIAGSVAVFLPESLNENLPQNISDLEQYGKDQKFLSFNRKKLTSADNCPEDTSVHM